MSKQQTVKLAIELGRDVEVNGAYGRVHRAGCRDLHDGMSIGEASTKTQIGQLVELATDWDVDTDEIYDTAPCVKLRTR
jgi:hypothetical protein